MPRPRDASGARRVLEPEDHFGRERSEAGREGQSPREGFCEALAVAT